MAAPAAFNSGTAVQVGPLSADSAPFDLSHGGYYSLAVTATWADSASVQLELLGPDGATQIDVGTPVTANGIQQIYLPSGTYTLAVTTATDVYARLERML